MKKWQTIAAPSGLILLMDLFVCFFSLLLTYQLRFNFKVPESEINLFRQVFGIVLGIRFFGFILAGTYRVRIRFTATPDVFRLLLTVFLGSAFLALWNPIHRLWTGAFLIPYSIIIIEFLVSIFFLVCIRLLVRLIFKQITASGISIRSVIIYGAGETGLITKRTLESALEHNFRVVAFLDENKRLNKLKLENVRIWHPDQAEKVFDAFPEAELIISKQSLTSEKRNNIAENALAHGIKILNIPSIKSWISGHLNPKELRNLRIEDLLEREPIVLNKELLFDVYGGKVILVTGAAGSIGSELALQLLKFNPRKLVLLDQAETPMHELDVRLQQLHAESEIKLLIADITDKEKMQLLFESFKPEVVFHAAAYKHVPLMERNPSEAAKVNTWGTKILADLAHSNGVERFVFISTDKAVNPTNVMGATKRMAEIYAQSFNAVSDTKFITTRFGNVLGSNGSVVPRFRAQIEAGGPVTVTHPEITRYFMTIPEACSLVLEAGSMGNGGEIYIFDMGKPVKIRQLAEKMIRLAGFMPEIEIAIEYTGLRPGEKLYEELINEGENTLPTHHPQIMITRVIENDKLEIDNKMESLAAILATNDNFEIVKCIKEAVPEYRSANSEFEKLDV